ncbi:serine protease [Uliginosibacterium sp. H3]|uniref:Serine protease n=1 Tax=Uliginosibacterium silvisoli TaxID=3114758 RepID=A0ABU6K573_9RHOO|nr:serine protease [Uliginosibacterium sp. H3]
MAIALACAGAVAAPRVRNAETLPAALLRAEQALALKSPDAAALFEHASHVAGESATAEVGMVRAYLAEGQYRRALAFAHLVQGEHTRSNEAMAWMAYLNDRSGQTGIALRMLEVARATQQDDVALLCAQSEIFIDRQQAVRATTELDTWLARNAAQPPIIALRHRASIAANDKVSEGVWRKLLPTAYSQRLPQLATRDAESTGTWITPWFDELPAGSWQTSSGFIVDSGTHVITALPANTSGEIRVRDAKGNLRRATVERALEDAGLVLLRLEQALPHDDAPLAIAPRLFPGSPFHAIGFPVRGSTYAALPTNTPGFFGRPANDGQQGMLLGQAMPAGLASAPVFNANAQLAGFISPDTSTSRLLPAAVVLESFGIATTTGTSTARPGNAEIYERALSRVVLVAIVQPATNPGGTRADVTKDSLKAMHAGVD